MTKNWNFLVTQIGARQHYAVPKAFHSIGYLGALFTDFYNPLPPSISKLLYRIPSSNLKNFLGRCIDVIPDSKITQLPFYARTVIPNETPSLCANDKKFALSVLKKVAGKTDYNGFFGFSSASLELLQFFKKNQVFTILDQISPGRTEWDIVQEASKNHPEFASVIQDKSAIYDRCEAEWKLADKILVNSTWSKHCLMKQGVPSSKIVVIPISIDTTGISEKSTFSNQNEKLKIIWLGTANIRKGIHLLIDACRHFINKIEVHVYGGVAFDLQRVKLPDNIFFKGSIPRADIYNTYQKYDIFVLPTLSDGFAITQLEAQKMGLPLICTKHCGDVIQHGINGRLMDRPNVESLCNEIQWFLNHRDLIPKMSKNSQKIVLDFSYENYQKHLKNLLQNAFSLNKDLF